MGINEFRLCLYRPTSDYVLSERNREKINTDIADMEIAISRQNIVTLMKGIGKDGWIFCPSTFQGQSWEFKSKSPETFQQSQLFVLSFDNQVGESINEKLSYEEIEARAKRYGLPMLFAYKKDPHRWAETKRREFSIVFLNESPVTDLREAEAMHKALMTIFPEADKDCSALKLHEGGRGGLLHADETIPTINAEWLLMNMCLHLKERHGSTNYKRKIDEFSRVTGVRLDDRRLPDISVVEVGAEDHEGRIDDKNSSKCIKIIGSDVFLSSWKYKINFMDGDDLSRSTPSNQLHQSYQSIDLKILGSGCRLYRELESGSRQLTHQELLGLASNLSQVKSGEKNFKAALSSNAHDRQENLDNWNYYFYYIRGKNSKPCTHFCPYHNTCQHGRDILSTVKPRHYRIERLANCGVPLVSLDEAWEDFNKNFQAAIASDEQCWHVIKSQTALGKTQALLEFLRDTPLNVLVAVPTNKLKREVWERAKKMGIDIVTSPSLHELQDEVPDVVWDAIQALYDAGKSPMPRLEKAIAENDPECAKIFKRYKRELSAFFDSAGHGITTHRRLPSMDLNKYDLIIVDEDIIYSTVIPSRETVSLSELKKLRKKLKKELAASDELAAKITKILKKVEDFESFTLNKINYHRAYADIKMAVNIPALCSAMHFCYRAASDQENDLTEDSITFIKPVKFPENKKYIMLSATADETICKLYFGEENVRFYSCKEAALTGKLYQYGDKPMGRSSIRKAPSIISRIKKWTGFEHTISFKEFHKYYTGDLHFGNCAGCDTLKGENIDVIGTAHQPEWIYKLFAYSLGYEAYDRLKPNTIVLHNGFRFRFITYADEILRAIQFYMIESELEQAVGRARLLRCDCTVNLFSDFPLKQAELRDSEYDTADEESQSISKPVDTQTAPSKDH